MTKQLADGTHMLDEEMFQDPGYHNVKDLNYGMKAIMPYGSKVQLNLRCYLHVLAVICNVMTFKKMYLLLFCFNFKADRH